MAIEKLLGNTGLTELITLTKTALDEKQDTLSEGTGIDITNNVISVDATEISYNDLLNKPTLATVATSGSYNDLSNTPTIPTKTSDLVNDGDGTNAFLTQHQSLSAYRTSANQDVIDDTKVDKVTGKGLSANDYTTAEKTKLSGIEEGANNYTLPTATTSTLGGVKIGSGISVQSDGTISVEGGSSPYVLPTMSASTKGGARLGTGLVLSDSDLLGVDVDNLNLDNNETITDIIDGTTEIDISDNSTITNIIDGTTPVPASVTTSYKYISMTNQTSGDSSTCGLYIYRFGDLVLFSPELTTSTATTNITFESGDIDDFIPTTKSFIDGNPTIIITRYTGSGTTSVLGYAMIYPYISPSTSKWNIRVTSVNKSGEVGVGQGTCINAFH